MLTFAFWTWQESMEVGLINALAVLLIACPCALGIATPLTLWVGLGRAAKAGIILRYTGVLERLASIEEIYFDKTGTLTKRPIRLQKVATDGMNETEFLTRISAVESLSEHPLGQAIVAGAEKLTIDNCQLSIVNFRALPGQGVSAVVEKEPIWIGNQGLMEQNGLKLSSNLQKTEAAWQNEDLTVIYAGWSGYIRGIIGLGEIAREEAVETIAHLQTQELDVAVLTGDDENAGKRWRKTLNIPVYAALAAAAVGLAVRQGTDNAQSAADAILMQEDLRAVPWLVALSRLSMHKVRQNLAWAVGYNGIGIVLAVTGLLQPSLAALLMVCSNLIVTANALRLRNADIGDWGFEVTESNEEENNEEETETINRATLEVAQSPA